MFESKNGFDRSCRVQLVVVGAAMAVAAVHCSSGSANNGAPGAASLVDVTPIAPGAQCSAGGYEVQAGVDANKNGVLDPNEVATTEYVCNGASADGGAPTQVTVIPVSPGAQCPAGGYEVQIGSSTSYVCNGVTPIVDASTGPQAVAIAAGGLDACALFSDGSVWCWGEASSGETGLNGGNVQCEFPIGTCTLAPVEVPLPHAATAIASGVTESNCALLSDGSVWCSGDNTYGELGTTAVVGHDSATPVQVELPSSNPATAITIGYDHACAVLKDGSVWCWGANGQHQLNTGTTTSSAVPVESFAAGPFPYVAIAAGYQFTCALTTPLAHGGNLTCWGDDSATQFAATLYGENYTSMAVGGEHVCVAQPADGSSGQGTPNGAIGTVMCTGDNSEGALGIGSTGAETQNNLFAPVVSLANASQLAAGFQTSCAVVAPGGSVACWGENDQGALGNGTTSDSSIPVWVQDLSDVTALASGGLPLQFPPQGAAIDYTCAISHGQVWCWGNNLAGQLGNGSAIPSTSPVLVAFGPAVGTGGADASADAPADAPHPDGGSEAGLADGWQCASEADCTGTGGAAGWACCLENGVGTCVPAPAYPAVACPSVGVTLCEGTSDNNYCYGVTGGALMQCGGDDASAPTTNDAGVPLFICH